MEGPGPTPAQTRAPFHSELSGNPVSKSADTPQGVGFPVPPKTGTFHVKREPERSSLPPSSTPRQRYGSPPPPYQSRFPSDSTSSLRATGVR